MHTASKTVGEWLAALGLFSFLIFVSGLDAPENDIRMIYIMIASSITVAIIGGTIAEILE